MNILCSMIRGHEQWVYHGIKFGNYKNDWSLLKIREIFQDPDSPISFGSAHVSHQASIPSSSKKAWPRFKNAAKYTRGYEYSRKRFWLSTCPTCLEEFHDDSRNFGNTIGDSEKRRNWEKWEWRTIAINTSTFFFGESEGKSPDDRSCLKSMTNNAAGIGTCTQSGMAIPSYPSWEMHLGKFPDHTEFQSWVVNFRVEVCAKAKNDTLALQWIKEIEAAKSLDDLITPKSVTC